MGGRARGGRPRAVSWHTIAKMTITVPSNHCRLLSNRNICRIARPPLPSWRSPTDATPRCWTEDPKESRNAPRRATGIPTYASADTGSTSAEEGAADWTFEECGQRSLDVYVERRNGDF